MVILIHDRLELVEIRIGKRADLLFGKLSEHEVHFANPAVPAAVENTATARREVRAAAHKSCHGSDPWFAMLI